MKSFLIACILALATTLACDQPGLLYLAVLAGLGPPHWSLMSVSKRDLPRAGMLTVRLQLQGNNSTATAAASQVELT